MKKEIPQSGYVYYNDATEYTGHFYAIDPDEDTTVTAITFKDSSFNGCIDTLLGEAGAFKANKIKTLPEFTSITFSAGSGTLVNSR